MTFHPQPQVFQLYIQKHVIKNKRFIKKIVDHCCPYIRSLLPTHEVKQVIFARTLGHCCPYIRTLLSHAYLRYNMLQDSFDCALGLFQLYSIHKVRSLLPHTLGLFYGLFYPFSTYQVPVAHTLGRLCPSHIRSRLPIFH